MLDAKMYLNELVEALKKTFGDRLVYVGLQGSYLRGEATDSSDIDPMVVIDGLTVSDLKTYRAIVETLPEPDKSCGFLCGREELSCWNPLEISHLLHTTRDIYGVLTALVPAYNERDMRSFIQLSIGNLYHELCHRYVHGSAEDNRCFYSFPEMILPCFSFLCSVHPKMQRMWMPPSLCCLAGAARRLPGCKKA